MTVADDYAGRDTEVLLIAWADVGIRFSNLEFGVGILLNVLIDRGRGTTGSLLTDFMPLSRKLDKLRCLTEMRLANRTVLLEEVREILTETDELRKTRNTFIHGMWVMDPADHKRGIFTSHNFRFKQDKTGKGFSAGLAGLEQNWSRKDLDELAERVGNLVIRIMTLVNRLPSKAVNPLLFPDPIPAKESEKGHDDKEA